MKGLVASRSERRVLKRPAREPWPLVWRACGLEGTEEMSILFRKI